MKKFLVSVMEWKASACFLYTGSMVVYLYCCLIFHQTEVKTSMLWMLLLVCAVCSLFQWICFTDWLFKKLRYFWRLVLFCVLFLPFLAGIAWTFQWFPMRREAWLGFLGIFLAAFSVMTIGFEIYYRITGRKYDGLLGQYRREKENQDK